MREREFEIFLESLEAVSSKDKAVRSRITKGKRIGKELKANFDEVVKDDFVMYETLVRIKNHFGDKNGTLQNSLRKYYLFANGKDFPLIKKYEQQMKK